MDFSIAMAVMDDLHTCFHFRELGYRSHSEHSPSHLVGHPWNLWIAPMVIGGEDAWLRT